jgi:hypothetical protein
MATTVYSCVRPTGYTLSGAETTRYSTRAYSTIIAWNTARARDLVAADEIEICEVIAGDETHTWATADIYAGAVSGFTTDATRYVKVTVLSGARHDGKWNTNRYRIAASNASAFLIYDDYVTIDGLQLTVTDLAADYKNCIAVANIAATNNSIKIENCILKGANTTTYNHSLLSVNDTDAIVGVKNCVVYEAGQGANCRGISLNCGTAYISNCTVSGCYRGYYVQAGTVYFKNCIGTTTDGADFYRYGGTLTQTNCASEDLTGDDFTPTDCHTGHTFTFVNAAIGDFHLGSSDTGARGLGADLTSDTYPFIDDIDYVTRAGTWDIGADQYVASAGGIVGSILNSKTLRSLTQGRLV